MGKKQTVAQQQGGVGNLKRAPGKMANAKQSAGRKNKSMTYGCKH